MAPTRRHEGNLPAEVTSVVGRRRELVELRKKLAGARLITLVGPGGVGKTRLAMRAATDLGRAFPDGAWLVDLGEIMDSALITNVAVAALDLRDQAATEPLALLLGYLRGKQLLLVVDNCEHVLAAAAELVSEIMKGAPGVRVIATSREPLSIGGEYLLRIPPFELPDAAEPRVRHNDAVMLFTERAVAAAGGFDLTATNQSAEIGRASCRERV